MSQATTVKRDITQETVISLRQATGMLHCVYNTALRYSREGYKGVFLDTVRIGARRRTSVEAVNRFIAACSKASGRPHGGVAQVIPSAPTPSEIPEEDPQDEIERKLDERLGRLDQAPHVSGAAT